MIYSSIRLPFILLLVVFVSCGTTAGVLYQSALDQKRRALQSSTNIAASLIESVAAFDAEFSGDDHPGGAFGATLAQIRNAFSTFEPFYQTGELLAVQIWPDAQIHIVAHQPVAQEDHSFLTKAGSPFGPVVERALDGQSGVTTLPINSEHNALVAFNSVQRLNVALLAIVPIHEISAPFFEDLLISILVTIPIAALGGVFIYQGTSRIIRNLHDSEDKFIQFSEGSSDWFWEQDKDFKFTSVSMYARVNPFDSENSIILGLRRDQTTTEDITSPKWRRHIEDLEAHRPFKDFTFSSRERDGSASVISVTGFPIFDARGRFKGYRGTGRNLTEQVSRSQALKEAEERLRVAFEAVTCGIIIIDRQGIIQSVNPESCRIFGYDHEAMVGNNVSMLMSGTHAIQHDSYIANYLETGDAKIIGIGREVSGARKDGAEFPLFLGIGEMNIDGRRQFIASITDLTKQRNIEHQLRRAQKMDAIGQLTGGLAHDFNNLLGIVIGNLDLAKRKAIELPAITRNLDKAIAAAERGTNLTRRLLNFSRQTPLEVNSVDLNEVVLGFRALTAQSVLGQAVLQIHLAQGLPTVICNQSDLEDALLNISINARDAMPDGGRLIIETGVYEVIPTDTLVEAGLKPGWYATLTVSDTGVGIPPEIQERIFEPFFTTKMASKGTGLGLPMVYGFVQRSRGHITVYSEPGLGTTIRIYLPVSDGNNEIDNLETNAFVSNEMPTGHETVLVVDDEPGLREIAESTLSELGYKIIVAENGYQALSILRSNQDIDLLFTDLVMPGSIDGLQLAEMIMKEQPKLKILLTSGFTGQIMDKKRAEQWTSSLLTKPYSNARLAQAVRTKLDQDD